MYIYFIQRLYIYIYYTCMCVYIYAYTFYVCIHLTYVYVYIYILCIMMYLILYHNKNRRLYPYNQFPNILLYHLGAQQSGCVAGSLVIRFERETSHRQTRRGRECRKPGGSVSLPNVFKSWKPSQVQMKCWKTIWSNLIYLACLVPAVTVSFFGV